MMKDGKGREVGGAGGGVKGASASPHSLSGQTKGTAAIKKRLSFYVYLYREQSSRRTPFLFSISRRPPTERHNTA